MEAKRLARTYIAKAGLANGTKLAQYLFVNPHSFRVTNKLESDILKGNVLRDIVVRLKNDWASIREAAITVSLAFSDDPLIKWIRPGARSWGELDVGSLKFQHRRVQRMNEEFAVLQLRQVGQNRSGRKHIKSASISVVEASDSASESVDYDAIAMLEPPRKRGLGLRQLYVRTKYWLMDTIDPCRDLGINMKRLTIMMDAHNSGLEELRRQLHPRDPWYVEVIAVRPSSHGKGLGGHMMRGIIDMAGEAPIVLECTDKATIGFYRKYGFEEVKEMVLKDPAKPEDDTVCFWMVRK